MSSAILACSRYNTIRSAIIQNTQLSIAAKTDCWHEHLIYSGLPIHQTAIPSIRCRAKQNCDSKLDPTFSACPDIIIMSGIFQGTILLTKQITQEAHKTESDLRLSGDFTYRWFLEMRTRHTQSRCLQSAASSPGPRRETPLKQLLIMPCLHIRVKRGGIKESRQILTGLMKHLQLEWFLNGIRMSVALSVRDSGKGLLH